MEDRKLKIAKNFLLHRKLRRRFLGLLWSISLQLLASNHRNKQGGYILVTTMIFLAVLNLIIIASFEVALVEERLAKNLFAQVQAMVEAQNKLVAAENDLGQGIIPISVSIIPSKICGITFYRVYTEGVLQKAKCRLQSIFVIKGDTSKCKERPKITLGRQSWREIR